MSGQIDPGTFEFGFITGADDDVGPLPGEFAGEEQSESPGAAGDQGGFAFQIKPPALSNERPRQQERPRHGGCGEQGNADTADHLP